MRSITLDKVQDILILSWHIKLDELRIRTQLELNFSLIHIVYGDFPTKAYYYIRLIIVKVKMKTFEFLNFKDLVAFLKTHYLNRPDSFGVDLYYLLSFRFRQLNGVDGLKISEVHYVLDNQTGISLFIYKPTLRILFHNKCLQIFLRHKLVNRSTIVHHLPF